MLHEASYPIMTLSNHHGSTGSPKPTRISNISYELSEDLRAKELEFMERCYGGRIRAHRAARIIQRAYRKYKMKKEYTRLKSENRISRRLDSVYCDSTPKLNRISPIDHEKITLSSDLVTDEMVFPQAWMKLKSADDRDSFVSSNDTANSSFESSNLSESLKSNCSLSQKDIDQSISSEHNSSNEKSSGFISNNSPDNSPVNNPGNIKSYGYLNNELVCNDSLEKFLVNSNSSVVYSCNLQAHEMVPNVMLSPEKTHTLQRSQSGSHEPASYQYRLLNNQQLAQLSPTNRPGIVYVSPTKAPHYVTLGNSQTKCVPIIGSHYNQFHTAKLHQTPVSPENIVLINKNRHDNLNRKRKRLYRIGLNIFNKSSVKGVDFLIKCGFLESNASSIAKFLLTRRGLSRFAIGDYLGNSKDEMAKNVTRYFIRYINLRNLEVDEALRTMLSYFRTPGEAQKIQHLMNEFQFAYCEQNPEIIRKRFRTEDTVMLLAYAIVMLHTDSFSSSIRPQDKMTKAEFIRNLRQSDNGEDVDNELLSDIYDRIQAQEMTVQSDHTDLVRKIESNLTGPLRPRTLALPQRRLVCYCRLFEVMDKNKKEKFGSHERDVFLFNDLLLITKPVQKKRKDSSFVYSVKNAIDLLGLNVLSFENQFFHNGIEITKGGINPLNSNISISSNLSSASTASQSGQVNICLNTKTPADKASFLADLQECILEVTEMDRIRISDEMSKMNASSNLKTSSAIQIKNPIQHSATSGQAAGRKMSQMINISSKKNSSSGEVYMHQQLPPSQVIFHPINQMVPNGNFVLIPTPPSHQPVLRRHSGQSQPKSAAQNVPSVSQTASTHRLTKPVVKI